MGKLTTHVLDTARGLPAQGLAIDVVRMGAQETLVKSAITNSDGRCDAPMLEGAAFTAGQYELRFHAGAYLRQHFTALPDPLFLDVIPIRFGIASAGLHYHVPLLLSPFGYSTYRGS